MRFDSEKAHTAAADLEALITRLETGLRRYAPATQVVPAGRDEVSTQAAETMTTVATNFEDVSVAGIGEIRNLAAALRSHADQVTLMDGDNALGLAAGRA
ncbi:PE family protein [Nocardia sp. NPDC003963]